MIYLALYKGHKTLDLKKPLTFLSRFCDYVIRVLTRSKYSHCEIAIKRTNVISHSYIETYYNCYSSSLRDGGVRTKRIEQSTLENSEKWDLIYLSNLRDYQVINYFNQTKGRKYDVLGVLGLIFGIKDARNKFFCSEWCYNVITNTQNGWRFNPGDLAVIFNKTKE
ncbi:enoyl-CoA hydratase [Mergibacter septicus]|uniref:enoyl-CoA hydratase n=1 Tax=Mergibacter septicus TaxID=221402 RepID=UPI001179423C|nr:enoyl-CoA hydratase [Mergibacter septicus]AWX14283.1 enoyl-CoA hydratase [Mergibacter septicus]